MGLLVPRQQAHATRSVGGQHHPGAGCLGHQWRADHHAWRWRAAQLLRQRCPEGREQLPYGREEGTEPRAVAGRQRQVARGIRRRREAGRMERMVQQRQAGEEEHLQERKAERPLPVLVRQWATEHQRRIQGGGEGQQLDVVHDHWREGHGRQLRQRQTHGRMEVLLPQRQAQLPRQLHQRQGEWRVGVVLQQRPIVEEGLLRRWREAGHLDHLVRGWEEAPGRTLRERAIGRRVDELVGEREPEGHRQFHRREDQRHVARLVPRWHAGV